MWHRFLSGWWGAGLGSFLLLFAALGVFSSVSVLRPSVAAGQQDDKLAVEAPAAKAAEAGAEQPRVPTSRQKSWLRWLYESLRLMYSLIFLFLSITLVALMVMNVLGVRRDSVVPAALVQAFESCLDEKRYQDAYEMAKNDESFLGQVLSAGLAKVSSGYDQAMQAMQEVGEEESMKLEHRLGYVALIAQIGPMFGLLGTVDGMVQAFEVIASKNVTPKPSELAQGIGTALVTTVVGLWIAIPSIAFFNIIRARLARLLLEAGVLSENLMSRFSNVGTKKT